MSATIQDVRQQADEGIRRGTSENPGFRTIRINPIYGKIQATHCRATVPKQSPACISRMGYNPSVLSIGKAARRAAFIISELFG